MQFSEYQQRARETRQMPAVPVPDPIVPLLGLAGETGELLGEYKKFLRDGSAHTLFPQRVAEELGDLLWYLSDAATVFGLDLEQIAAENLAKCQERWGTSRIQETYQFDLGFDENERFPRQFSVDITTVDEGSKVKMRALVNGEQLGNDLTDNAHERDDYRYHDVFHLACAAILGWSPVIRTLLKRKRKSDPDVDEVEDGGRATAIEEGIAALVFSYAVSHNLLKGVTSLDYHLLKTIKGMVAHLEVHACTLQDWERAILTAYDVWRSVAAQGGGTVVLDLDSRSMEFKPLPP